MSALHNYDNKINQMNNHIGCRGIMEKLKLPYTHSESALGLGAPAAENAEGPSAPLPPISHFHGHLLSCQPPALLCQQTLPWALSPAPEVATAAAASA